MAILLEQFAQNLPRSALFSADELSASGQGLAPQKRPHDANCKIVLEDQ